MSHGSVILNNPSRYGIAPRPGRHLVTSSDRHDRHGPLHTEHGTGGVPPASGGPRQDHRDLTGSFSFCVECLWCSPVTARQGLTD